jgi:hypothetical protein
MAYNSGQYSAEQTRQLQQLQQQTNKPSVFGNFMRGVGSVVGYSINPLEVAKNAASIPRIMGGHAVFGAMTGSMGLGGGSTKFAAQLMTQSPWLGSLPLRAAGWGIDTLSKGKMMGSFYKFVGKKDSSWLGSMASGVESFYNRGDFWMPKEMKEIMNTRKYFGSTYTVGKDPKKLTTISRAVFHDTAFKHYMKVAGSATPHGFKGASGNLFVEGIKSLFDERRIKKFGETFLDVAGSDKTAGVKMASRIRNLIYGSSLDETAYRKLIYGGGKALKSAKISASRLNVMKYMLGAQLPLQALLKPLPIIGSAMMFNDAMKMFTKGAVGIVKGATNLTNTIYNKMVTGGMIIDRGNYMSDMAVSERQRAIQAIQESKFNARSMIGNEARMIHR